jgi:hypothetical protein
MYAAKVPTDIGRSRSDLRPGLEAQLDRIGEATGRLVAAFRSAVRRGLTLGTSTAAGHSPAGGAGIARTAGPNLPDGRPAVMSDPEMHPPAEQYGDPMAFRHR